MNAVLRAAMLVSFALLTFGAAPHWLTTVSVSNEGGHVLGNPDAKVKLIAFESYTCHVCNDFEKEAGGAIRLAYIQPGKVSLEVRNFVRDPVDLTGAMLASCVPPAKFFDVHRALFLNFSTTYKLLDEMTDAQKARWFGKDRAAGRRAIAEDFGFYDILAKQGLTHPQADQCINNDALAKKIADATQADDQKYDISGTPSFAINGLLLFATHNWQFLQPQIDARL
jgi:protein-disulfide isomerase